MRAEAARAFATTKVEAAREVASSATMVAARVMLGCGEDDTV